jgi:phage-related protein
MPPINIIFFMEDDGSVPVLDWLDGLPVKTRAKCVVKMERLQEMGHELRRPEGDYLRDEIYELRIGFQGQNYRILYFFHGREAAILTHGLIKERIVPPKAIDLAILRKKKFERHPERHTFRE